MPSLDARITALETQDATTINRVILYEPGEPLPELPAGDGVVILLPNNHREDNHHAQP